MSNNYFELKGKDEDEFSIVLTAYVGGKEKGNAVQINIDRADGRFSFAGLGEKEIKDLIGALKSRLNGEITATGEEKYIK